MHSHMPVHWAFDIFACARISRPNSLTSASTMGLDIQRPQECRRPNALACAKPVTRLVLRPFPFLTLCPVSHACSSSSACPCMSLHHPGLSHRPPSLPHRPSVPPNMHNLSATLHRGTVTLACDTCLVVIHHGQFFSATWCVSAIGGVL